MPHNFDAALLIGRFQPFHLGHAALLQKALEIAPRVVLLLGSAYQAPSPRNPFTVAERIAIVRATLSPLDQGRVLFLPQRDTWDTPRWMEATSQAVQQTLPHANIVVVGHQKESQQNYLAAFPQWSYVGVGQQGEFNATAIRHALFSGELSSLQNWLAPSTMHFLETWMRSGRAEDLRAEHLAVIEYQERWGKGPFVTTDAIVECAGHVLAIRRGRRPGLGLMAMPGGFLEPQESFLEGALRELDEETGLKIPTSIAQSAAFHLFAHPGRSLRARIITQAYHFRLPYDTLPPVQGADDAQEAFWLPIASLRNYEEEFFEDHAHILDHFLHYPNPFVLIK